MPIPKHLRDSLDARLPQTKQGAPGDKETCKAESGQHEANFEELKFVRYIGANSVLMRTTCLHCNATAEIKVHESDAEWVED